MARTSIRIDAPQSRVFAILSDAHRYPDWVVGASDVRDVDDDFPAVGSRFHHRVGVKPLTVNDHTEVLDVDPPRHIALKAKARPLGTALIDIELTPAGDVTDVVIVERPGDLLSKLVAGNPVADYLLARRNDEALRRLKRIVESERGSGASAARARAGASR